MAFSGRLGGVVAAVLGFVPAAHASPLAHITSAGPAPAAQSLQLVLPLKADLSGLRQTALAITTPGSPDYGQYLPLALLARRYGASAATRAGVISYLRRAGARAVKVDPTGLFAHATMSVALAERVFVTPLQQFRADGGVRFVAPSLRVARTASVPVPTGLRGLVTGVIGLDTRPVSSAPQLAARSRRAVAHAAARQQSSAAQRSGTPAGCAGGIGSTGYTPNQYLTAYGLAQLQQAGLTGAGVRAALIEIDGFKPADIRAFASCFSLPIPEIDTFGVGSVSRSLAPGGEATLDVEVLDAAAPGLKSIDVYEAKPTAAETLAALTAPLGSGQKPQVVSVSLGLCEPILHGIVKDSGIVNSEGALEMASATGITYLASSGDQGSADCTGPDGGPIGELAVNYPASSWWVTGVGGTNFTLDANNQITSELVWNDAADQPGSAGGGGESDLFRRPNYQKGFMAADGRGVPDVAMLSDIAPGYAIYCSASSAECVSASNPNPWTAVGGTSAATPLLAGGFALVDQQLARAGRQPLGLVNPLLYATAHSASGASVFRDITVNGNDIGPYFSPHRALGCCAAGVGYDKASGLGSMNLAAFALRALSVQPKVVRIAMKLPGNQHPIRQRGIRVTVSCDTRCLTGAFAEVTIGRAPPFEIDSSVIRLVGGGSRTLILRFSSKRISQLRKGLSQHKRITARIQGVRFDGAVYGVLQDPGYSIAAQTGTKSLQIKN